MSYSATGKALRLRQMENRATGRSITVALDHGLVGVPEAFAAPRSVLAAVLAARPDAVLLTPGMAAACRDLLAPAGLPLVVSLDYPIRDGQRVVGTRPSASVETAVQVGAHCVKFMLFMDGPADHLTANVECLRGLKERCEAHGVPLMVEPVAWELEKTDPDGACRAVLDGCRLAVELGADVLKVGAVAGRVEMLLAAVGNSPVPVAVLGGARRAPEALLAELRAAGAAGAWGAVVGRNVWQHGDPAGMVRAMASAMAGD